MRSFAEFIPPAAGLRMTVEGLRQEKIIERFF